MFETADYNQDGGIDFKEFVKLKTGKGYRVSYEARGFGGEEGLEVLNET